MLRLRILLLAAAGLAATLAFAAPQARADSFPLNGLVTLQSQHFMIHYDADYRNSDYMSQAEAGDVLGAAERAYSLYTSWGYAPPSDDSQFPANGLIDIVVLDFSALGEPTSHYAGLDSPDGAGATTPGVIYLDVKKGTNVHAVAHELFVLFEWKIFHATAATWFEEGSAEWAAYAAEQFITPDANALGEPDRTLDCLGSECGYAFVDDATYDEYYDRNANPGWSFFEYLNEKYGTDFIRQLWLQAAADGQAAPATQPIDELLATKGSSLSSAFNGWITARLNGDFQLIAIRGALPQIFTIVATGGITASIPTTIVAVNHLAARYVEIDPGDGTNVPCYAATLALTVTIPSGVTSAPYLYTSPSVSALPPPPAPPTATPTLIALTPPQALTVSGNTASISIPWNTCTGGAPAYLSLPNATVDTKVNGNEFTINGTLTVDPKTPATPNLPPTPTKVSPKTPTGTVPTSAIVPTIDLFGSEVIHLSGDDTTIDLVVRSDTDGKVQASLGSYALGTAAIRAGANNLQFALPAGAVSNASSTTLTLTPFSASGTAGTPVTRTVQVDSTVSKVQAKAKAKAKAKKAKPKKRAKTHRR